MTLTPQELKPCPFCGGPHGVNSGVAASWAVDCHDCVTRGPWAATEAEAITAWNQRTPTPTAPESVGGAAYVLTTCGCGDPAIVYHAECKGCGSYVALSTTPPTGASALVEELQALSIETHGSELAMGGWMLDNRDRILTALGASK